VTINGYLGTDCITPFLAYEGKGLFILVKTSNPSSAEFQDLFSLAIEDVPPEIGEVDASEGKLVRNYLQMAKLARKWGESRVGDAGYSDIGAVVGATFPTQMALVRDVLPSAFFLIPGYGAQGGTAADIVHGVNPDGLGAIVNSARGIDYAYQKDAEKFALDQYAEAARAAVEEMNADIAASLQESGKIPW
jgi:orotidine-5'-phosphate decarboxylase